MLCAQQDIQMHFDSMGLRVMWTLMIIPFALNYHMLRVHPRRSKLSLSTMWIRLCNKPYIHTYFDSMSAPAPRGAGTKHTITLPQFLVTSAQRLRAQATTGHTYEVLLHECTSTTRRRQQAHDHAAALSFRVGAPLEHKPKQDTLFEILTT